MAPLSFVHLLGAALLLLGRQSAGQTSTPAVCKPITNCACEMSDGSGVMDLTPLRDDPTLSQLGLKFPGDEVHTYYFNPCSPLNGLDGDCATSQNAAGCQKAGTGSDAEYYRLGKQDQVTFTISGTEPFQVRLKYDEGTPTNEGGKRSLVMTAACEPDQEMVGTYDGETGDVYSELTYAMTVRSKHACLQTGSSGGGSSSDSGLSAGSIMTIIFFCLLVTYFAVGVAYMHGKHGKTGVELIPNLEFWKSLPGLIKEGALFATSPCRDRLSSSGGKGEEYEKL